MAQKKIYLIRHGKAVMGGFDHERILDEDGKVQAKSLCKKLKSNFQDNNFRIISSPFKRALQTVEEFSKSSNIEIEMNKFLEEINIGKDQNLSKHEIIKKMWEDINFKVANGESQQEYIQKISNEMKEIINNFHKNNLSIIIVSHGNSLGIILKHFFSLDFDYNDWKKMTMPDMYALHFDENNKIIEFKRDIAGIEKIFVI